MSKILDNFNEADFANLDNESLAQMINGVSLVDDISQIDPLRMNSLITTAIERMEVSDDVRYELGRKLFENNAITENLTENNFDLDGFKSAVVAANIDGATQKQDYKPDLDLMVKHFRGEIDVDAALGERAEDLFLRNAAILSLYGESQSLKELPEYEQNKINGALKTIFDHFSDNDYESVERYKNIIGDKLEENGNNLEAVENLEQEVNKAMEERFDFGAGTISNRPMEELVPTREELIQEKLNQIRIEEIDWVKRYNDYLNSLGDEVMIMSSGEKMKEKLRGQNGFSPMNARLFGDSIVTIDKYGHAQDTVFNMAPNGSSMTLSKSFSYADPKQTEKMFHLAALKARSSGWEKIYLSHPGPNANAELFLERSINSMLDVDYNLSAINVPKKYQYVLDKIKLERPEISQEARRDVEYANINTPEDPEADSLEAEEPVLDNPELEADEPDLPAEELEAETPEIETPDVEEPAFDDVEFDSPEVDTQEVETPEVAVQEIEDPLSASEEIEPEALEEPTVDELAPPEYDVPPIGAYEQEMNQDYVQAFDDVEFDNPEVATQEMETPDVEEPTFDDVELENPEVAAQEIETPAVEEPTFDDVEFEAQEVMTQEMVAPSVEEPAFDDVEFVDPSIDTPEARLEVNSEKLKDIFSEDIIEKGLIPIYPENIDPNVSGVDIDRLIDKISDAAIAGKLSGDDYIDLVSEEAAASYFDKNNPRNENLKNIIDSFDLGNASEKDRILLSDIVIADRLERVAEINEALTNRKDEIRNLTQGYSVPMDRANDVLDYQIKRAEDDLRLRSGWYLKDEIRNFDPEDKKHRNKLDSVVLLESHKVGEVGKILKEYNSKGEFTADRLQGLRDHYETHIKPREEAQAAAYAAEALEAEANRIDPETVDFFADDRKEKEEETQRRRNGRGMGR